MKNKLPDFVQGAHNVYRTEKFIIKQVIAIVNDKDFGEISISFDSFYPRTKERDKQYNLLFPKNKVDEGCRYPAFFNTRQYNK